jgi:hypothetical protein
MNLEKPYKVFEPTDTAIDYSPTRMAWYLECNAFWKTPKNHNDSNVKISLPTREQADCFLNDH